MFSPWSITRPSYWYPISTLEQSLMDFDDISDLMLTNRFPLTGQLLRSTPNVEEDDFFKDLPVAAPNEKVKEEQHEARQTTKKKESETEQRAFSSYAYSTSSLIDDNGNRVESCRRRYEDSNGRLKAEHIRRIGEKEMKSIWHRKDKKDTGEHKAVITSGADTETDFEKLWARTPFGEAEKKKAKQIEAEGKGKGKSEENP
jgi:hypothetical protein